MKNEITIFTDGSSRGNPGRGGWGAIIVYNNSRNYAEQTQNDAEQKQFYVSEIGGKEENTTNNRMELTACIESLSFLSDCKLKTKNYKLFTDSSYLVNGITKWIHGWKKNDWKTSDKNNKKPVENRDLWEKLDSLVFGKKIEWKIISGHSGIVGNERCDEIATAFSDGKNIDLYKGDLDGYPIKNILDLTESVEKKERKNKSRSRALAYSYVSFVDGKIEIHKTWPECEARVKGKPARFKKALSAEEEKQIISEFSK